MLIERVDFGPTPSIRAKFESILEQLKNENFEPTLLLGSMNTLANPVEYLAAYVLWYRGGEIMPFYCECLGDAQQLQNVAAMVHPPPDWQDRTQTLCTGLRHAKAISTDKENPYLIGVIAPLRSTTTTPILACFQREDFPKELVAAIFSHYPKTF